MEPPSLVFLFGIGAFCANFKIHASGCRISRLTLGLPFLIPGARFLSLLMSELLFLGVQKYVSLNPSSLSP